MNYLLLRFLFLAIFFPSVLLAQNKKFIPLQSSHFAMPCLVNDILFDANQNIWLAMENGLLKMSVENKQSVETLFTEQNSSIRQHHINCLWSSNGKQIWAGTYNKGLVMLDSTGKFHHFPFSNHKILLITAINQTAQNQILVATQTDGIYALSEGKLEPLFNSQNSKLLSNHVNFISSDWAGRLWCGTESGVSVLNSEKNSWKNYPKIGNAQCFQEIENQCFISSLTEGGPVFWQQNRSKWKRVNSGIFNFGFRLKDIVPSSRYFWVTSDRGLIQFDGEETKLFDQRHGLPEGEISHITISPDSILWLATTSGLYKWVNYIEPLISFPSVANDSLVEGKFLRLQNIHFSQSKAVLADSSDKTELQQLAKYLLQHTNKLIEIHGHTDDRGNQVANWQLSKLRAHKISELLIMLGVSQSQIKIIWHGETEPLLPNTTEANRLQNRRVEIKLLSIIDE